MPTPEATPSHIYSYSSHFVPKDAGASTKNHATDGYHTDATESKPFVVKVTHSSESAFEAVSPFIIVVCFDYCSTD